MEKHIREDRRDALPASFQCVERRSRLSGSGLLIDVRYSLPWKIKERLTRLVFGMIVALILFTCGIVQLVSAATEDNVGDGREGCSYVVVYENDQLFTDRNYTFGGLLIHVCKSDDDKEKDRPWFPFLRAWNEKGMEYAKSRLVPERTMIERAYGHYKGLSLYTPNSLKSKRPEPAHGRPYASLLIYGDSVLHADKIASIKQEIQMGIMGHPIGGVIQETVHSVFSLEEPQGWSTEISRGGEPVVGYSLQGKRLLCGVAGDSRFCGNGIVDLTAMFGGSLGYYTSLKAGFSGRLGRISSSFWDDYGSIGDRTSQAALVPESDDEFYLFGTAGLEVVGYSAVLQGQLRRSEYVVSASDVQRTVPYASFGLVVKKSKIRLSVSHNLRRAEVKGGKMHRWTTFSVGCFF